MDNEDLVPQLYKLLAHLNDIPYLENHPLARRVRVPEDTPGLSRGQVLRRALRRAIAALDPGGGDCTLEARPYRVLYHYAISRQGMPGIAEQLSISPRQAYRELRCATEALLKVLADVLVEAPPEDAARSTSDAEASAMQVRTEVERLSGATDQEVDLSALVSDVASSLKRLAHDNGVALELHLGAAPVRVTTNRVMLRQAVLNLLSHGIRASQPGAAVLSLRREATGARLRISYHPGFEAPASQPQDPYAVARQLFASLGIALTSGDDEKGSTEIEVSIPLLEERTVLVIDDNEGLIRLYRRFLRDQPYAVHGATDAESALSVMDRVRADVVLLDIMMPDRDGWEVLEALRRSEAGSRARIIVCSIINDPELAATLGADAFLLKPVRRPALLQALNAVLSR